MREYSEEYAGRLFCKKYMEKTLDKLTTVYYNGEVNGR